MRTSKLRPGLLVYLRTSVRGNVSYRRNEIVPDHITAQGTQESKWETERVIADPQENERATKARSKARSVIGAVCSQADYGLLCLQDNRWKLDDAILEAERIAAEFNESASMSRFSLFVNVYEIAPDDAIAIRAINTEMSDLMAAMEAGLRNLDVDVIRAAADKARSVAQMLEPAAQERVKAAIAIARTTARQIVKAAEEGAAEVDRVAIARIAEARTSFLDLEEAGTIGDVASTGRAVDLAPMPAPEITEAPPPAQGRMFEL